MLWITGSKGLLASALYAQCKATLQDLRGPPKRPPSLGSCMTTLPVKTGREVDVGDLNALRAFVQQHPAITHIVNCAAFNNVDSAEERRNEAYLTNVMGPANLALVAKEIGAKLVHISTDYVFSREGKVPLKEEDPANPCNYYGVTKLEGERRALDLSACVIRTSWIFGMGGKIFVSKLLEKLLTEKEVQLVSDQWSRFTYAPDLAGAILQMLDQTGLYQYANRGVATRYEFGLAMREEALALGYPVMTESILPMPSSNFAAGAKRPIYSAFDTTKIEQLIPIRPWRDALRNYLCEQLPAYS